MGRQRSSFIISLALLSFPENASLDILRFVITDSFKNRFTKGGYLLIAIREVDFPRVDMLSTSSL